MPRSRDHAVENLRSDRFKLSREGRRCDFRNDRGRIATCRGMRRPCLASGIEGARDGKPARCRDDHPGDDVDDIVASTGRRGEQQYRFRPSAIHRTPPTSQSATGNNTPPSSNGQKTKRIAGRDATGRRSAAASSRSPADDRMLPASHRARENRRWRRRAGRLRLSESEMSENRVRWGPAARSRHRRAR